MRHAVLLTSALALALAASGAEAQKLDSKGRCHDAHGKYAKMEVCKGLKPVHAYKMDPKGKCRDDKGHFADMKLCMAH